MTLSRVAGVLVVSVISAWFVIQMIRRVPLSAAAKRMGVSLLLTGVSAIVSSFSKISDVYGYVGAALLTAALAVQWFGDRTARTPQP